MFKIQSAHAVGSAGTDGYPWDLTTAKDVSSEPGSDGSYTWGYTQCLQGMNCSAHTTGSTSYYYRDGYGYDIKNCTSYVAWKVNNVEQVVIPNSWGNASNWASAASGKYAVDNNPQYGDVAQSNSTAPYGHVGFVKQVNKDSQGNVTSIEVLEYNKAADGNFTDTTYNSKDTDGKFWRDAYPHSKKWDNFIHIKGLTNTSNITNSRPVAVSRGSNTMDVFYRDTNNNLVNIGWNSTTGWNVPTIRVGGGVMSNPVAVARDATDMDVFYVNNGNLMNIGWNATSGWGLPSQKASGVASDPVVIARDLTDMDVFYVDSNHNLQNVGWSAAHGWVGAIQRASGVVGNPTAVARDWANMDIFYRDSSNNLINIGWNATYGWSLPSIRSSGDVTGNPYVVARDSIDMDVFYQGNDGSTQNNLRTVGWNAYHGWNTPSTKSTGDVSGDPSAVGRDSSDMDVFYRDFNGNLRNVGWNATYGWGSPTTRASGSVGDNPFALSRDSVDMDVFYRDTSSNLVNIGWNATNGWYTPTTRAGGVQ